MISSAVKVVENSTKSNSVSITIPIPNDDNGSARTKFYCIIRVFENNDIDYRVAKPIPPSTTSDNKCYIVEIFTDRSNMSRIYDVLDDGDDTLYELFIESGYVIERISNKYNIPGIQMELEPLKNQCE